MSESLFLFGYCGEISHRRLGPIRLVYVGYRRYLEIKLLRVWRRV